MPSDLSPVVTYVAAFIFVIALIAVGAWLLKTVLTSAAPNARGGRGGLLRGRHRRLGVVEAASVDARRKLVLLRRDDVEHLIMTGGPVDVLIETGIKHAEEETEGAEAMVDDDQVIIARDYSSADEAYDRDRDRDKDKGKDKD